MKQAAKSLVNSPLKKFGLGILKSDTLKKLRHDAKTVDDIEFILALPQAQAALLLQNLKKSKAEQRQDLFVLSELGFNRHGFFVEFGAANGLDYSNTHLLEKEFGWTGILAEPAKCWHDQLMANRAAFIETDCVWSHSNSVLVFNETRFPELSTINSFSSADEYKKLRRSGKTYEVKTISLNDLLKKYNAPRHIDYLSIDTEGSEVEILASLDFSKYRFKVITCEHNYTPIREKIYALLSQNGYVRKFQEFSKTDDWYVESAGQDPR